MVLWGLYFTNMGKGTLSSVPGLPGASISPPATVLVLAVPAKVRLHNYWSLTFTAIKCQVVICSSRIALNILYSCPTTPKSGAIQSIAGSWRSQFLPYDALTQWDVVALCLAVLVNTKSPATCSIWSDIHAIAILNSRSTWKKERQILSFLYPWKEREMKSFYVILLAINQPSLHNHTQRQSTEG